ncbi:hypothetical protein BWQ93_18085 [Sphingopyxis sp. QXT-31]|uniref:DUF4139 domain-containing protein n=1 Tax=Sphingopyxis sp. QXT-31 TaxID=1357916 RepID=UPI00097970EB|nr:hypothetical protein [Sphingopyxis sp. QXT-31]AQA00167.1 hypothetical protein BWQ93_18085 [Sphingopyxis sp. QXT-31]
MRAAGRLAALLLVLAPATAGAQGAYPIVQSVAPGDVAVTVYRAPYRSSGGIDPDWPEGFAFITETRTVDLPAGTAMLRFEGVAEGLLPETAVVSGLPDGVIEKNRDARLLSPAGLVDAYLKRLVTLQRTDPATGKVRRQDAIIQAGPNGGVLLKTAEGYEALGCSGLPERMTYGGVPKDLSAKPTLSVLVESDRPRRVTIQLLYLAEGFDWSANYVAERSPDAPTMAMTGWITLANGGVTSFPGAQLNVIAGRLEKQERKGALESDAGPLVLQCWPMDITSTHPLWQLPPLIPIRGSQSGYQDDHRLGEIVVSAKRREESMMYASTPVSVVSADYLAQGEDLGDLKYYRLPFRTDVAAKQQKQVALLAQDKVQYEQLYSLYVGLANDRSFRPAGIMMRVWNRKSDGLGLAMPAGTFALFEQVAGRRLLVGEAFSTDRAIDERIDFEFGASGGVQYRVVEKAREKGRRDWEVTVTNDRPVDAEVEMRIPFALDPEPVGRERRGDSWIWRVRVPANGTLVETFREKAD